VLYLEQQSVWDFSSRVVLLTIGGAFALSAIYMVLLREGRALAQLGYGQIVIDQALWTVLAYVSGGVASGATSFYGLTCLTGAVVAGVRGVAVAAVSATTFYCAMCFAFAAGALKAPPDQVAVGYYTRWSEISFPLTQNLLVLSVVSMLAGYLAERLRRTGGQLEAATVRAEEAERLAALGRFAAGLAHEIRNPLGSISGSIELLAAGPSLNEEDRLLCGVISREASRLNDLVTDMLDLARPRRPELGVVDAAQVASEVAHLAARSGRGGDVRVVYEGPAGGVEIEADAAQFRQVLWNLVRNAVQASAAGRSVTVRVKAAADRESPVVVEVQDQGEGIPKSAQAQLFDAFFTTRTHGIGIGLAVVKRVVEDHGWSIEVDSGVGIGATFRVVIVPGPRPAGHASSGAAAEQQHRSEGVA
jgi:two-component system, NtrC family, sensor histidine kinase HydH